jgi:mRNA-degrading endonuclease RelE of RelBE toxin-antitoxin system
MAYKVKSIAIFERQVKRLQKKYPSLKNELLSLVLELKINPEKGTAIGRNCFKIRLSIASKGKKKKWRWSGHKMLPVNCSY